MWKKEKREMEESRLNKIAKRVLSAYYDDPAYFYDQQRNAPYHSAYDREDWSDWKDPELDFEPMRWKAPPAVPTPDFRGREVKVSVKSFRVWEINLGVKVVLMFEFSGPDDYFNRNDLQKQRWYRDFCSAIRKDFSPVEDIENRENWFTISLFLESKKMEGDRPVYGDEVDALKSTIERCFRNLGARTTFDESFRNLAASLDKDREASEKQWKWVVLTPVYENDGNGAYVECMHHSNKVVCSIVKNILSEGLRGFPGGYEISEEKARGTTSVHHRDAGMVNRLADTIERIFRSDGWKVHVDEVSSKMYRNTEWSIDWEDGMLIVKTDIDIDMGEDADYGFSNVKIEYDPYDDLDDEDEDDEEDFNEYEREIPDETDVIEYMYDSIGRSQEDSMRFRSRLEKGERKFKIREEKLQ